MSGSGPVTGYALLGASLGSSTCSAILVFWFHCRRAYPPIKARFWWQSEILCFAIIAWALYRSVSIEFPGLGTTFYVLSYPLFLNIVLAGLIRLSNVYSAYKIAALYTEWKSSQNALDIKVKIASGGFFVRHARHIQNPRSQSILIFVHTALQSLLWVIIAVTTGEFTTQEESVTGFSIMLFYGVPMFYLAVKILPMEDGLYLRQEIMLTFYGLLFGGTVFILLRLLVPSTDMIYVKCLVVLIGPIQFVIVFIGLPLYKSYVWQKEAKRFEAMAVQPESFISALVGTSSQTNQHLPTSRSKKQVTPLEYSEFRKERSKGLSNLTLNQVLASPDGVEAFKEFCTLELNYESILFFLDARDYCAASQRAETPKEERTITAKRLYEKYIKHGAPLEINVGDSQKQKFIEAGLRDTDEFNVEDIDQELLDEAFMDSRDEVFKLMATDAFVRFLRHRLYRELVNNKEKQKSKRRRGLSLFKIF